MSEEQIRNNIKRLNSERENIVDEIDNLKAELSRIDRDIESWQNLLPEED